MSLDAELRAAQRAGDKERVLALRARRGDKITDMVWATQFDGPVRVVDMTDNHLTNTIRMLRRLTWGRNGPRSQKALDSASKGWLVVLVEEAKQRGLPT